MLFSRSVEIDCELSFTLSYQVLIKSPAVGTFRHSTTDQSKRSTKPLSTFSDQEKDKRWWWWRPSRSLMIRIAQRVLRSQRSSEYRNTHMTCPYISTSAKALPGTATSDPSSPTRPSTSSIFTSDIALYYSSRLNNLPVYIDTHRLQSYSRSGGWDSLARKDLIERRDEMDLLEEELRFILWT